MGSFEVITEPTSEPVTLQEAKDALKILHDDEDGRITSLIKTAREFAEAYCGIFIMTTIRELKGDAFLGYEINLDTWPLQSIDSVKYDDTGSPITEQTLVANTDYYADTKTEGGRLRKIKQWPSVATKPNAIRIRMTAGYSSAALVPESLKDGIKAYIIYLYELNIDMERVAKSILWQNRRYL